MKNKLFILAILPCIFWIKTGLSQNIEYVSKASLNVQPYLALEPDIANASMKYGYVNIPFIVTNNTNKDVILSLPWNKMDKLMTQDDSANISPIDGFANGTYGGPGGGPRPQQVVLKPGESGTYNSIASLNGLAFVANKKKKIMGAVTGKIVGANQEFESYSVPFSVPSEFTKPPWVDLGEQTYFKVTPDLTKALLNGGSVIRRDVIRKPEYTKFIESGWAESLLFPVEITNTTNEEYIAATDLVTFYIQKNDTNRQPPNPWESIKASKVILKPGKSAISSGRSYINLHDLELQGYNQGDKLIAAVGGRIPNTNQIFECYSAPFELPPLPKNYPSGSQSEIVPK